MWRTLFVAGLVSLAFAFGSSAIAQSPDPLLIAVGRVRPDQLPEIAHRLRQIAGPERAEPAPRKIVTVRDLDGTTAREARQLADNPTFARAYENSPAATLFLLRSINQLLDHSPGNRP